jgi:Na+/melibiose symporter-like transporter
MNGKYKTRIGMALAYMGGSPIFLIISSYLVYFYTNVVGLNGRHPLPVRPRQEISADHG